MADPDWNDPCAVAAWLRPRVARLAIGEGKVSVSYAGRTVEYGPAKLAEAQAFLAQKEAECAAKSGAGTSGRRRAFTFG